jgi:hypothetical protein
VKPNANQPKIEQSIDNFGLDLERMKQCREGHRYYLNGREICRAEAFAAIEAGGITDDADFLRLTWVGAAETADKLRKDLAEHGILSRWNEKVTLQDYRSPDDPMLKDCGFTKGLQVQSPDGLPLWYAAEYGGPEKLAEGLQIADARRKDAAWDPNKWPDLAKPPPAPSPGPDKPASDPTPSAPVQPSQQVPPWAYIGGVLVLIALFVVAKGRAK